VRRATALWPYAAALLAVLLEWGLLTPEPARADHFQFWAAGHIVATGGSVYDRGAWSEMAAYGELPDGIAINTVIGNLPKTQDFWLYPPQTAIVLAPFGALPLASGIALLHVFIVATALLAVALSLRAVGLVGVPLGLALVLAVASEPFVMSARAGHPVGLVLLGCALIFLGLRDRRWWLIALGVPLATIKAHIAIAFLVACVVYVLWTRSARAAAAALAGVLLFILPAYLRDPFPVTKLLIAANERSDFDVASATAFAREVGGGPALAAALVLLAGAAAAALIVRAPASLRGGVAFGALVALSLAVAPYAHDYDQLLVLPAAALPLLGAADPLRAPSRTAAATVLLFLLPYVLLFWWDLGGVPDHSPRLAAMGVLPLIVLAGAAAFGRRAAHATRTAAPVPA
jgi:hypothetical protein